MAPFRLATRFFSDSVGAMLSPSVVSEVRRLLALGELSQRKIARLTGVSRSVVRRIATGKRKDRSAKPKEAWEIAGTGKIGKCPTCGARVKLPCVACLIREIGQPTFETENQAGNTLKLESEHKKRYEQVKEWREQCDNPRFSMLPRDWPFYDTHQNKDF